MIDPPFIKPSNSSVPLALTEHTYDNDMFSLLLDNVRDYAIFVIDGNGNIISWNRGAENIKGYTTAEIIGKHISVFYTKQDKDNGTPLRNLQQAKALGRYEDEGWRVRKDGSVFWANVVFTPLYTDDGMLKGYAKITRDITERKKAEDILRYQASLLEITSDAIYSLNATNKILSWNKAAETMYGYTAAEVMQKDIAEIIKPVMAEPVRQQLRAFIDAKGFWSGEVLHTGKYGVQVPVFISVAVHRNSDGEIEEYVCICRDISAKKAEEEKARWVQAELERLTQSKLTASLKDLSDYKYALDKSSIVAITNQKGIIQYVNENFCTISGYSQDELVGQDHRIVNSGYHNKEFIRNLWATIANGNVWKGELKNKAKNGTYYWVDTTIIPFLNDNAKPYQYVAIRADITNRKEAEEQLKLLNEKLEEHVEQRTRQLDRANKELEAFSYSVSHDLRAPLRSVSGFAKILEDEYGNLLDEEGHRLVNKIITNAVNMGRLIDDLLAFTRLGKKQAVHNQVNMGQLAQSCIEEIEQNEMPAGCIVTLDQLPPCKGDVNMLKQVWLNLIGNAFKYSSKVPHPAVHITGYQNDAMNVYCIKDNGAGFDMQYYEKLFGVFQRLHASKDFAGTGVGLALVKLIITKHGGTVWAESSPGNGAAFYFSLPKHNEYDGQNS